MGTNVSMGRLCVRATNCYYVSFAVFLLPLMRQPYSEHYRNYLKSLRKVKWLKDANVNVMGANKAKPVAFEGWSNEILMHNNSHAGLTQQKVNIFKWNLIDVGMRLCVWRTTIKLPIKCANNLPPAHHTPTYHSPEISAIFPSIIIISIIPTTMYCIKS